MKNVAICILCATAVMPLLTSANAAVTNFVKMTPLSTFIAGTNATRIAAASYTDAGTNATLKAANKYTDEAISTAGGMTPSAVTNIAKSVVSAATNGLATTAYVDAATAAKADKLTGTSYDFGGGTNFGLRLYTALTNVILRFGGSITNAPAL